MEVPRAGAELVRGEFFERDGRDRPKLAASQRRGEREWLRRGRAGGYLDAVPRVQLEIAGECDDRTLNARDEVRGLRRDGDPLRDRLGFHVGAERLRKRDDDATALRRAVVQRVNVAHDTRLHRADRHLGGVDQSRHLVHRRQTGGEHELPIRADSERLGGLDEKLVSARRGWRTLGESRGGALAEHCGPREQRTFRCCGSAGTVLGI
jgi:hypothetical protein